MKGKHQRKEVDIKLFRKIISLLGVLGGLLLGLYFFNQQGFLDIEYPRELAMPLGISLAGGFLVGFIFYFTILPLVESFRKAYAWIDIKLKAIPTQDIVLGAFALVVALLIGLLLSIPLSRIPSIGVYISPVVVLVIVFLSIKLALSRKEDFAIVSSLINRKTAHVNYSEITNNNKTYKILDTSVIIDGRIVDICKTDFLEGIILVPEFVLEELRHIADSTDVLKRNRGRRGLDVLHKIQKEMHIPVEIYEGDFEDIAEVDSKLVKLAKLLNGKIITNDYNLNKVCELQGVSVLNINELANAVKPVVLPGEEMQAQIIKDGKEAGQGVAYLEDGTMIVVEGGKKHIGETLDLQVTSVLQTAAGRMIFAKPKNSSESVTGVN